LTEDVIENLSSQNEAIQFDDWITDFDDEPEIDGDCNESQPCRGDEYCDDAYNDLDPTPTPSRIRAYLQPRWHPIKGIIRRCLCSRFSWPKSTPTNAVKQDDTNIPF
jgi:hypothetical protein